MKGVNGFTFFKNYYDAITDPDNGLTAEEQGELYNAIAAKKLKLKTVPCKIAADLTADEVKKLRALDNKLNESEWNLDMLSLDIGGLEFKGFDIDWGIIKPDDFGTEFAIASGDKSVMETMTFTLHHEQAELIRSAMETVLKNEEAQEAFGNTNRNGNAIYEVVRQWAELKK